MELSGAKLPKKKNADDTQEITITRVTNPKKVESSVIEVQTDFDDNIKDIKIDTGEAGSSELFAKYSVRSSVGISTSQPSPNDRKYTTKNAEIATVSPSLRESETQVESSEIAVQHAEVGTETEPADVIHPVKRTVDIGIQTGNIILERKDTPPTMTSIAIQADKSDEIDDTESLDFKSHKSEEVPHPSHKNTHTSDMNIESLPVSLPLLRDNSDKPPDQSLKVNESVSQIDDSSVKSLTPLSNGAASDSDTAPRGKGNKKSRPRAQRKSNKSEPVLRCQINKTRNAKDKNNTMTHKDQSIESDSRVDLLNPSVSVEPLSPSIITPAHVSVIKRTPEKRGGSRPFCRPRDMILPAIDTAQIDVLLNDSPSPEHESNKQNRNSKSPGRTSSHSQRSPKTGANPSVTDTQTKHCRLETSHKPKEIAVKKGRGRPRKRPRPEEGSASVIEPLADKVQSSNEDIPPEVEENSVPGNSQTGGENTAPPSKKSCTIKLGAKLASQQQEQRKRGRKKMNSFQGKKMSNNKSGRRQNSQPKITEYVKKTNTTKQSFRPNRERTVFPPAFPEKDPYDFDTLSTSDFEPLPDLRQRRKRRKSKGFAFELETRKKKKKKPTPQL